MIWCSQEMQRIKNYSNKVKLYSSADTSRFGSEPPSVEDDVDVWCYAIVSCMPETTRYKPEDINCCLVMSIMLSRSPLHNQMTKLIIKLSTFAYLVIFTKHPTSRQLRQTCFFMLEDYLGQCPAKAADERRKQN